MAENVNKKLLDTIKKSQYSDSIKNFLLKIVLIEFEFSDKSRSRFSEKYDPEIKKYSEKYDQEIKDLTQKSKVEEC